MDRRTYLASAGSIAIGLAGCIGHRSGSGTDTPGSGTDDPNPDDGYPPESAVESTPESREVDPSSFETLSVGDVEVPLVPVDVAHYWFQRREARFADARGEGQYDESHVTGAVLSTARNVGDWSQPREGTTTDWSADDRIVCYCGCPHHLSSLRAGEFISKDYQKVYAIDEGFFGWRDQGYPVTGGTANQQAYVVRGRSDLADAGAYAWATHQATDQQEATPIGEDGSYHLELHFADVDLSTPVHLQTPSYELTAPLSELTESVVLGPQG